MRPLLLLMLTVACSTPAAASSQTPAFDPAAIVARDELVDPSEAIDPMYAASFDRAFSAELDGAPPLEWLIVSVHAVPEAAAEVRIAPYRWDGSDWAPLPTLSAGGYMESGYVEVLDLEGDGQDELLLVGDTDGVSRADLSVVRLVDGRFEDLVWGVDSGAAYASGDLDADGTVEIVGLTSLLGGGPSEVLGLAEDGFLRARRPPTPSDWLPGLLAKTLSEPAAPHRLDGLAAAMRHSKTSPGPASVPLLLSAWDTMTEWDREPLVVLLSLTGSTEAEEFLAQRITMMDTSDPHRALGAAAGPLPLREAVLKAFARRVTADELGDMQELVEGALPGFAAQGDVRLREAVAAALLDPITTADVRGDLVYWVLPEDPGLAPVLVDLLESAHAPEMTRLTALALERAAGRFAANPEPWRSTMNIELGRRLLDADSHHTRKAGFDLLLAHEAPPKDLVARALRESDVVMQRHLVGALPKGGPTTADSPALQLLDGDSQVRRGIHFWIARGDDPARWLEGLARVKIDDDLESYSHAAQRDPQRTGPAWRPVQDMALAFASDERPRFRQRASELLGGLPGRRSTAALIGLLDDDVIWVRTTAADALARHADKEAMMALIDAARTAHTAPDRDSYLVGELLNAVGATQRPYAALFLASLVPEPGLGEYARHALALAGTPGAEILADLLDRLLEMDEGSCEALHRTLDLLARTAPEVATTRLPAVRARACEGPEEDWLPGLIDSWERSAALAPITALTEHPSRKVRFAAMTARGRLLRAFAIPRR
jgi:hypothetical protein